MRTSNGSRRPADLRRRLKPAVGLLLLVLLLAACMPSLTAWAEQLESAPAGQQLQGDRIDVGGPGGAGQQGPGRLPEDRPDGAPGGQQLQRDRTGADGPGGTGQPGPGGPQGGRPGGARGGPPEPGSGNLLAIKGIRVGDSPVDASGVPAWTKEEERGGWLSADPETVSSYADQPSDYFWAYTGLPFVGPNDMYIMLDRVSPEIRYDVYVGSKLVYSQDRLGISESKLASVSPVFVRLGRPAAGEKLYFRLHSSNGTVDLKLLGPLQYGSELELKLSLIRSGLPTVIAFVVFFVLGLVSLLIYFINRENETDLYFSLFSLFIGFNLLLSIRSLSLFLPFSDLDRVLRAPLIAGMGYCFCMYFAGIFRTRFDRAIRHLAKIILLVGLIVPVAQWVNPAFFNQHDSFLNNLNQLGYYTGCLLCFLTIAFTFRKEQPSEAKWFAAGFSAFLMIQLVGVPLQLYVNSHARQFSFEPHVFAQYLNRGTRFSVFFSTIFFAAISIKRYAGMYRATRAHNEQLELKNAELQRMDELKDHFLANTSHELRTPLNGIIGLSESLLGGVAGELPEQAAANLRMITASGRRLASLVNDILDFSKLRHDEIRLVPTSVDLRQLTELVLLMLQPMLAHKPLVFRNALPDPLFVRADENRVQQILYNLLGNAVKFTDAGEITVTAERHGGLWHLHVSDTGIGIARHQQEAVFDSFVQSDGSAARAYGGTGLGLPITKQLVELHGGSMWLESEEGVGSVFSFSLPAADEAEAADAQPEPREPLVPLLFQEVPGGQEAASALAGQLPDAAGDDVETTSRTYDILIVDDEPVNLQVLHNYLRMENHRVTQAAGGQQALDILDSGYLPDLLIIDVMMPRMTGFELCRRIREKFGSRTSLPILMLTAKDQERDVLEGFNSGTNDYITKPVSRSELMARLRLHLQLAEWNRSLEERVAERTLAIRNLLDNAGQGFLTFDALLLVQEEYSAECRSMFGRDIAYARIDELLSSGKAAEQEYITEVLDSVFTAGDELHRQVCLSLLPEELTIGEKKIVLQYKWMDSGRVMAVLTDISEQRRLENKMESERRMLKMVVQVITYYRDFKDLIDEYRTFAATGVHSLMAGDTPLTDKWSELYHHVHTFKGNLAQIDFMVVVDKLHALETELLEWQNRIHEEPDDRFVAAFFGEFIGDCDWLGWLEADLAVLRGILGDNFEESQDTITLETARLRQLERRIASLLTEPEAGLVTGEIRKLRYRPFRELLAMYRDYVHKLAGQTGKAVHPLELAGGELLVDPETYGAFARSLIHVFRNMLDHGIETVEQRLAAGKAERGRLRVDIIADEPAGWLELRLYNDGAPLDMVQLQRLAEEKGMYTAAQFAALSPAEQRSIIFAEQVSTRSAVSELSGRGVGLSAVRRAVEELGGTIALDSSAEQGTTFTFRVPLR